MSLFLGINNAGQMPHAVEEEFEFLMAAVQTAFNRQVQSLGPAPGQWLDIPYNTANFNDDTSAGLWVVEQRDVKFHRYMVLGNTMWLNVGLEDTTIPGGAFGNPMVRLPSGYRFLTTTYGVTINYAVGFVAWSEVGVTSGIGTVRPRPSNQFLQLDINTAGTNSPWSSAITNNLDIFFNVMIPVVADPSR